jgi:hypothetical protein
LHRAVTFDERARERTESPRLSRRLEQHAAPLASNAAAARRFLFKVRFLPMTGDQIAKAFRRSFGADPPGFVLKPGGLTRADFATVARKASALRASDSKTCAQWLEYEAQAKPTPRGKNRLLTHADLLETSSQSSAIPRRGTLASSDAASHLAPDPIISIVDSSESLLSRLFCPVHRDRRHALFFIQSGPLRAGSRPAFRFLRTVRCGRPAPDARKRRMCRAIRR